MRQRKNKYLLGTCIVLLFWANSLLAQKANAVTKIQVYAVSWDAKYNLARNPKNIKQYHEFYFKNGNAEDFNNMFLDYKDCVEKLSTQKALSDSVSNRFVNALVEISFGKKTLSICFDKQGNFYFNNVWHTRNNELFFMLFKYFSNEIISQKVLEETKDKYIDDFWHPTSCQ